MPSRHDLIILSLAAAVTGGTADAACPTAADLVTGVRVTETDETVHDFRLLGTGEVLETIRFDGETDSVGNLLALGVYVVGLNVTTNGLPSPREAIIFAYAPSVENLPLPADGLKQTLTTTVSDSYEDSPFTEIQTHVWRADSPLTIGDCVYERITGEVTYTGNDSHLEEIAWLPDLGLGLLLRYSDSASDDRYEMETIEVIE